MRTMMLLALVSAASCRPAAPRTAVEAEGEGEAPAVEASAGGGPSREVEGGGSSIEGPRAAVVVNELTQVISAAVTGRDMPEVSFGLPGRRGEEVVQVQGDGFPQGELEESASMLKLDVTLEGCEPAGGLTLGILQTRGGLRLVGLGDQFTPSTGALPAGFAEVEALVRHALARVGSGAGSTLALDDASCEATFGSVARCHRMFQELPDVEALERYRAMLSTCDADPGVALDVVALWLVDEGGVEFQALARFRLAEGRLSLAAPIMLAPGVP